MKPDEIKKIRVELELTQEELAKILGVTKATVVRYESSSPKSYSPPKGDPERKLAQLQGIIADKNDKKKLLDLRKTTGGISILAGIIAFGVAAFPIAAVAMKALGLNTILSAPGITTFSKFLKNDKKG